MVKRPSRGGQVWSMEKLDNKLVDMREMYDEWRRRQQRGEEIPEEVRKLNASCTYPPIRNVFNSFHIILSFNRSRTQK